LKLCAKNKMASPLQVHPKGSDYTETALRHPGLTHRLRNRALSRRFIRCRGAAVETTQ
jgi:hypothetical protein